MGGFVGVEGKSQFDKPKYKPTKKQKREIIARALETSVKVVMINHI